jgi:hypothetical protein
MMRNDSRSAPLTPEERWGDLGLYGARGMSGGEALARQLDNQAASQLPSVNTPHGLAIRLRYLTWDHPRGPVVRDHRHRPDHRPMEEQSAAPPTGQPE